MRRVRMLDLHAEFALFEREVRAAIDGVLASQQFIGGPAIVELERAIADRLGVRHAIAVSSGTDALLLALMMLGINPGDEVILPAFTFFATAGSVARVGARPVFVDIDERTFNVDPAAVEAAITPKTKAIMVVHLFGQCADMTVINAIAARHDLRVIEDAAQAIGATQQLAEQGDAEESRRLKPAAREEAGPRRLKFAAWEASNPRGQMTKARGDIASRRLESTDGGGRDGATLDHQYACALGTIATLSFYPTKNLGGFGEGGMVLTGDDELATIARQLRTHGETERYIHERIGGNFRLDTMKAAILNIKLKHLDEFNRKRRASAVLYDELLADCDVTTPFVAPGNGHVYHQYSVLCDRRDELMVFLKEHGIDSGIYYPIPLHLQRCFAALGYAEGDLPVSERVCRRILSLPVQPMLERDDIEYVASTIGAFYRRTKRPAQEHTESCVRS